MPEERRAGAAVDGAAGPDIDEAGLRRSGEIFRRVAETSPEGLVIYYGGEMVFVNERAQEILGRTADEIRGMTHMDVAAPEERDRIVAMMEEYRRTGEMPEDFCYWIVRKRDGARRHIRSRYVPFSEGGAPVSSFILIEDLTEAIRTEQSLLDAERRYRALTEQSLQGIIVGKGWPLRVAYINDAFTHILGYTEEDVLSMSPEQALACIHPEDRGEFARRYKERMDRPAPPRRWEFKAIRKDGEVVWVEIFASVIEHEGERALQAVFLDVTERRRAEQERRRMEERMQHAQKLESLGVLAGGIAHDFNNLLMGILGNADLALLDAPSGSPVVERLSAIQSTAQRAADLCRQMLAYSGRGRFAIQALDLNEVIEDIAHLLEVSISKNAVLRYELGRDLPAIEADATQMRQIAMNLITNASEAIGDESGLVTLRTGVEERGRERPGAVCFQEGSEEGERVFLEVSDTGCGMDEETRERIFDPFFTTKFTGRGLGLAAVMGIVRGHKGAICVGTEPGKGTSIRVLFPIARRESEQISVPPSREEGRWRGSGTVLVIDDVETVRATARLMLESLGFRVLTAADGREGLEVFREHMANVSLVLLDMTMPRLGGEEAFGEIRRVRSDARVVMMSGYDEQDVAGRFSGDGPDGFLQKPFDLETLEGRLRKLLD